MLQIQGNDFTIDDVFSQYKGKTTAQNIGLILHYHEYLKKYEKLIGIEIKQITCNKFNYILNDLKKFVKFKYKQNEILLKNLNYSFILEFEHYIKTEKQKQITINKALQGFKKLVETSVTGKQLDSFSFDEHRDKRVITNVVYITYEGIEKLENHNFSQ